MRLYHGSQYVLHHNRTFSSGNGLAGKIIRRGKDSSEIVGGMSPFRCQPRVIKVQPPDHRSDIEGRLHRVELKLSPGHLCPVWNYRAWNNGAEKLRTCRIP